MRYKIPFDTFVGLKPMLTAINVTFDKTYENAYIIKKDYEYAKDSGAISRDLDKVFMSITGMGETLYLRSIEEDKFKLYEFVTNKNLIINEYDEPTHIDFDTALSISLQKKPAPRNKGMETTDYYYETKKPTLDDNGNPMVDELGYPIYTYENLIAKIEYASSFDAFGLITKKDKIIHWMRKNDKYGLTTKNIGIVYDQDADYEARIIEGIERRTSIKNNIQVPILKRLRRIYPTKSNLELLITGRQLLNALKDQFESFIDHSLAIEDTTSPDFGKKAIVVYIRDNLMDGKYAWIDTKLDGKSTREIMIEEFSI